jgi:hypothetical protein
VNKAKVYFSQEEERRKRERAEDRAYHVNRQEGSGDQPPPSYGSLQQ